MVTVRENYLCQSLTLERVTAMWKEAKKVVSGSHDTLLQRKQQIPVETGMEHLDFLYFIHVCSQNPIYYVAFQVW